MASYEIPGPIKQYMDQLANYDDSLDPGTRYYKGLLKRLSDPTRDVTSMPEFVEAAQNYQDELRDIDTEYGSGANQMLAQSGGPQSMLFQRGREIAKEDAKSRYAKALPGVKLAALSNAADKTQFGTIARRNRDIDRYSALVNAAQQGTVKKPSFWDKFGGLIQGGLKAGAGIAAAAI